MTDPQPQDADEFRVTRWQLQQIAKYADLERIVWACLNKPVESHPASAPAPEAPPSKCEMCGVLKKNNLCGFGHSIRCIHAGNVEDDSVEHDAAIRQQTLHDVEVLIRESLVKGGTTIKVRFSRGELLSMLESLRHSTPTAREEP